MTKTGIAARKESSAKDILAALAPSYRGDAGAYAVFLRDLTKMTDSTLAVLAIEARAVVIHYGN